MSCILVTMSAMGDGIRNWLQASGLDASLGSLAPKIPEWVTNLQKMGFTSVPDLRSCKCIDNYLNLWVEQAKPLRNRDQTKEQRICELIAASGPGGRCRQGCSP